MFWSSPGSTWLCGPGGGEAEGNSFSRSTSPSDLGVWVQRLERFSVREICGVEGSGPILISINSGEK